VAELGETCRCHRPLDAPPGSHWWPHRDPAPDERVQAVAIYRENPAFLRRVRVSGGWKTEGAGACHTAHTPPRPWAETGRCWAGTNHAVVEVAG